MAVLYFENLGGVVGFDYQFDRSGNELPGAEPPGDPWLRRWLGDDFFTNVTTMDLAQTEIDDADLKQLERLTDLQSLSLGPRVTDLGLEPLTRLSKLHSLDLRATRVTDAGVEEIKKALPHCTITVRR